jgi:hypothetical protein
MHKLKLLWYILKNVYLFSQLFVVGSGGESNAIGSCGIGLQESGPGRLHWQDLIHTSRKPTAMWHYLR